MSRRVIFNGKTYDTISALARSLEMKAKVVWALIDNDQPIGGEYVDYPFEPEEFLAQKQSENNNLNLK